MLQIFPAFVSPALEFKSEQFSIEKSLKALGVLHNASFIQLKKVKYSNLLSHHFIHLEHIIIQRNFPIRVEPLRPILLEKIRQIFLKIKRRGP